MYTYWHAANLLLNCVCLVWLIGGLIKQRRSWNTKSRDLWYSRIMWAITGGAISIENIAHHRQSGYTVIFISAATLVTLKALTRKGAWGYTPPDA